MNKKGFLTDARPAILIGVFLMLCYLRFNFSSMFTECTVLCTIPPWYCSVVPLILNFAILGSMYLIYLLTVKKENENE